MADPRPFRALYEHWERHQWSPFEIDFSVDAASFASLDEATRAGLVWVFAHRFHAEFNVAVLLAPFLPACGCVKWIRRLEHADLRHERTLRTVSMWGPVWGGCQGGAVLFVRDSFVH